MEFFTSLLWPQRRRELREVMKLPFRLTSISLAGTNTFVFLFVPSIVDTPSMISCFRFALFFRCSAHLPPTCVMVLTTCLINLARFRLSVLVTKQKASAKPLNLTKNLKLPMQLGKLRWIRPNKPDKVSSIVFEMDFV